MTHAWTHAWCKSPARDEAVRAAEDGRAGPLPTLEQCIEQAKQAAMTAGVKKAFIQSDTGWVPLTREHLHRLEQMIPKSVSASSAVEHENKGDGMATERVTLEITSAHDKRLAHCIVESIGDCLLHGESVRVVEEPVGSVDDRAYADRMGCDEERDFANRILAERDAAIRERDEARKSWLRSEESGTRLLAERNAALDAADVLRKRVAELEAASGGGEGEPVAYFVKWADKDWAVQDQTFRTRERAQDYINDEKSEDETPQIVPLYRSPPQPRGWLTNEERELIAGITDDDEYTEEGQNIAKGLLARSTPPEVVLESWREAAGEVVSLDDVRAALAAIGVAVKEVGGA